MSDKTTQPKDDPKAAGFRQDGKGDKDNPENRQDKTDARLDEALEETFPSSDPVSVKITK
ncbi:hypothetical protein [Methylobacterium organophilum]|uniref:Uncharacterized protein n=1 Tax=Methylobacterium organophilum TaxID=410 RepID=A0ABQ4T642_METOR|nr:hypothetical protein [Methylobacterium organophilum]UMY17671.1 hypothetical protein MMB17_24200 [Methylobacterium organophilum]GJE26102.1 hypothetical protein LKMONMHP_0948 [Methylobacterium organophilum]